MSIAHSHASNCMKILQMTPFIELKQSVNSHGFNKLQKTNKLLKVNNIHKASLQTMVAYPFDDLCECMDGHKLSHRI